MGRKKDNLLVTTIWTAKHTYYGQGSLLRRQARAKEQYLILQISITTRPGIEDTERKVERKNSSSFLSSELLQQFW